MIQYFTALGPVKPALGYYDAITYIYVLKLSALK